MVRLHKVTGEFDIADIRESFMRQYCTAQLNLVLDTTENNEDNQSYMKTVPINLVKSLTHGGRSGGMVEKNTGVSAVIRFVESFFLVSPHKVIIEVKIYSLNPCPAE